MLKDEVASLGSFAIALDANGQ